MVRARPQNRVIRPLRALRCNCMMATPPNLESCPYEEKLRADGNARIGYDPVSLCHPDI